MSHEEAALLRARAGGRVLLWAAGTEDTITLLGSSCPFYDDTSRVCAVYDVRPYNCRRYMCGREGDEPFVPGAIPPKVLQIKGLKKQYAMNQKKAQKWAREHGWSA